MRCCLSCSSVSNCRQYWRRFSGSWARVWRRGHRLDRRTRAGMGAPLERNARVSGRAPPRRCGSGRRAAAARSMPSSNRRRSAASSSRWRRRRAADGTRRAPAACTRDRSPSGPRENLHFVRRTVEEAEQMPREGILPNPSRARAASRSKERCMFVGAVATMIRTAGGRRSTRAPRALGAPRRAPQDRRGPGPGPAARRPA